MKNFTAVLATGVVAAESAQLCLDARKEITGATDHWKFTQIDKVTSRYKQQSHHGHVYEHVRLSRGLITVQGRQGRLLTFNKQLLNFANRFGRI